MEICGIICEYNPFHNGHLYQIRETRKAGATHIVAVMSGNFVQRGDVAIADKQTRAEIAVKCGADLVIELPVPYCTASAEFFAKGAVHILNSLEVVDSISFGSESGNISKLKTAVEISDKLSDSDNFKSLISDGISYPSAMEKCVRSQFGEDYAAIFSTPNNVLAVEYLRAIKNSGNRIQPYCVKREFVEHDSHEAENYFASASAVRKMILSGEYYSDFLPKKCAEKIALQIVSGRISSISNLEKIILYRLFSMTKDELSLIPDAGNGLADRIFNAARTASSLDELFITVKSKCFTMARIRRVIIFALLGVKASDFDCLPPYGRILALNKKGSEVLQKARDKTRIDFSTSLADLSKTSQTAMRFAEIDAFSGRVFSLATSSYQDKTNEFSRKIAIIE